MRLRDSRGLRDSKPSPVGRDEAIIMGRGDVLLLSWQDAQDGFNSDVKWMWLGFKHDKTFSEGVGKHNLSCVSS